MAAPFRQRFPLSVSSAGAILRCRGTVAAIIGRCLTASPVVIGRPSGFFGVGVTPGSALGVMGGQDPGFPGPAARKLTGSAASCVPKPSWCPGRALPRSRGGPTSPPLPSALPGIGHRAVLRARLIQPSMSAQPGTDRRRTHLAAEPDVNTASSAAPAAARTSGGQDTYSGPRNARTSPILEVGNPTDPFIPLRDAIAMRHRLAKARLLTVYGYGHTAFLTPSTYAGNYMTACFRTGALTPKGRVRGG